MKIILGIAERASKIISAISLGAFILAGLAVIVIAITIVVEVIARDLFNHPLIDIVTIGRMGMGIVGLLAAAFTLRMKKHISIQLVVDRLPKRMGKIVHLVGIIISFFCLVFLIWATFRLARFSQVQGINFEGLYTFPVYLPQMLVPLGLGLFALELLNTIVTDLYSLVKEVYEP
jgi:TRAP-type C4-dicarboxylate transport system permease small subunit